MLIAGLAFLTLVVTIVFFVLGLISSARPEPKADNPVTKEPESRPISTPYSTAPSSMENTTPANDTRYDELLRDYLSLLRDHRILLDDRETLRNELQKAKIDEARMIAKTNKRSSNESRGMQTEFVHVRSRTPMPAIMNSPNAQSFMISPNRSFCGFDGFARFSPAFLQGTPSPLRAIPLPGPSDIHDPRPLNNSECIALLDDSCLPADWWRKFDAYSTRFLMSYSARDLLLLWKADVERYTEIIESLAVSRTYFFKFTEDLKKERRRREREWDDKMQDIKDLLARPAKCDAATSAPSSVRNAPSSACSLLSFDNFPESRELSDDEGDFVKLH